MSRVRSFADLVARTWRENILLSVLLELTHACDLDCVLCYNDRRPQGRLLPTSRYLSLLDELREMEVLNLILSGGEPLAHRDFFRIGRRARALGFVVRVKSNASLIDGAAAARLRGEVDPYAVDVSLHGASAATHDRQTRVRGSFERLLPNLEAMVAAGLRVRLTTVLTRWNEHEIAAMVALADSLAVPLQFDPVVSPRDDGDRSPLALAPTIAGQRRLARMEVAQARAAGLATAAPEPSPTETPCTGEGGGGKHCGAASGGVAVDPWGTVLPCVQWRVPLGSLHESSMRAIWEGSAAAREVRRLAGEARAVVAAHGPPAGYLRFCPGLAAALTGDPLAVTEVNLTRKRVMESALAEPREAWRGEGS
jgi:MoaA/NifB/PqqE/SkfB family radical SAM enzyme